MNSAKKKSLCPNKVSILDFPSIFEIALALADRSSLELVSDVGDSYKAKVTGLAVEGGSFWSMDCYLVAPDHAKFPNSNSKFQASFFEVDKIVELTVGNFK